MKIWQATLLTGALSGGLGLMIFIYTSYKLPPTAKTTWTDQSLQDCYNGNDECGEVLRTRQLGGDHNLRKLLPEKLDTKTTTQLSGSFFFFLGGFSGSTTSISQLTVTFAWQMADGAYAIDTVPLSKIRVKLDDNATTPTARFRWTTSSSHDAASRFTADWYNGMIEEVTLTCRPEDWPVSITMPLSGKN